MKKILGIFFVTTLSYLFIFNTTNVVAANNPLTNPNSSVSSLSNCSTLKSYVSDEDIDLMARLVAGESIGEPYEGKIAVASVVLNRVCDPKFPDTIKGVIFQKNAFSCVKNNTINSIPNKECYNAVYEALNGYDPTNKALFFYNPTIATCSWMKQSNKVNVLTIGHHTFFKIE